MITILTEPSSKLSHIIKKWVKRIGKKILETYRYYIYLVSESGLIYLEN
jgi:hypothetical protein